MIPFNFYTKFLQRQKIIEKMNENSDDHSSTTHLMASRMLILSQFQFILS